MDDITRTVCSVELIYALTCTLRKECIGMLFTERHTRRGHTHILRNDKLKGYERWALLNGVQFLSNAGVNTTELEISSGWRQARRLYCKCRLPNAENTGIKVVMLSDIS